MKLTCTGRKVSLKEAFCNAPRQNLPSWISSFPPQAQAQVTVTVEKGWQTVELTVKDKGYTCRAEKSADRMEDALDAAYDLLERRIVKNRKRLSDRLAQPAMVNFEAQTPTDAGEEEAYVPVREKHFSVKPVTVEEAILEMNLWGTSSFCSAAPIQTRCRRCTAATTAPTACWCRSAEDVQNAGPASRPRPFYGKRGKR